MHATEQQDDANLIRPRRRTRLLMACLVIIGATIVLSRMLPAVLTIVYG